MLQWVLLYLACPLNSHSVSASKPVIGREEGQALLIQWLSMIQPLREQEQEQERERDRHQREAA